MLFRQTNRKSEDRTDADLLQAYLDARDLAPLGVLYQRYMHLVFGLCLNYLKDREEARDAVMQIFEKLIDEVPKHRIEHFNSWLYTVSKNHCLMQLRARQSKAKKQEAYQKNMAEDMESRLLLHHNDEPDIESDLKALERCIEELKEEQQACVKLFFLEEQSYRQIGEQLKLDLKKVKSNIQNGRRNLKICLEKNNG